MSAAAARTAQQLFDTLAVLFLQALGHLGVVGLGVVFAVGQGGGFGQDQALLLAVGDLQRAAFAEVRLGAAEDLQGQAAVRGRDRVELDLVVAQVGDEGAQGGSRSGAPVAAVDAGAVVVVVDHGLPGGAVAHLNDRSALAGAPDLRDVFRQLQPLLAGDVVQLQLVVDGVGAFAEVILGLVEQVDDLVVAPQVGLGGVVDLGAETGGKLGEAEGHGTNPRRPGAVLATGGRGRRG